MGDSGAPPPPPPPPPPPWAAAADRPVAAPTPSEREWGRRAGVQSGTGDAAGGGRQRISRGEGSLRVTADVERGVLHWLGRVLRGRWGRGWGSRDHEMSLIGTSVALIRWT